MLRIIGIIALALFGVLPAYAQIINPGTVTKTAAALILNECVVGNGLNQVRSVPCGSLSGIVTSFNTRTGAVVPAANDYNFNQLAGSAACSQMPAGTGDVTNPAGSCVNTLATVNSNVGTFGNSANSVTMTVNAKGLVTAIANVPFPVTSFNSRTGAIVPLIGDYTTAIVNHTPLGTGAVTRTDQQKNNDIVSVQDFGALCDGGTDDTVAFQKAIDAVQPNVAVNTGGKVTVATYPNVGATSACIVNGPVTLRGRVELEGNGDGTNIITNHATNDVFISTGARNYIRNLQINAGVTRTAGAYIRVDNSTYISGITMNGGFDNIVLTGFNSSHTTILDVNATGTKRYGISCTGGADLVVMERIIMSGVGTANSAGIWTDTCSDNMLKTSQFLSFDFGALWEPCNACEISANQYINVVFDHNGSAGFRAITKNSATSLIDRNYFTDVHATSGTGDGFDFNSVGAGVINGVYMTKPVAHDNDNYGFRFRGANTKEVRIDGGVAAFNAADGIAFLDAMSSFGVVGFKSGAAGAWSGNVGFGVTIAAAPAATNHYILTNNDFRGNTGGAINDNATGTNKLAGCVGSGGYNIC